VTPGNGKYNNRVVHYLIKRAFAEQFCLFPVVTKAARRIGLYVTACYDFMSDPFVLQTIASHQVTARTLAIDTVPGPSAQALAHHREQMIEACEPLRRLAEAFNTRCGDRPWVQPPQTRRPEDQRRPRKQTKRRNRQLARDANIGLGLAAGKRRASKALIAGVGVGTIDNPTPNAGWIAKDITRAGECREFEQQSETLKALVGMHRKRRDQQLAAGDFNGSIVSMEKVLRLSGYAPTPRRGRPPKSPEQKAQDAFLREQDRLLAKAQAEIDAGEHARELEQARFHGALRAQGQSSMLSQQTLPGGRLEPRASLALGRMTEAERQVKRRGRMRHK
jgi:hypothetical protein